MTLTRQAIFLTLCATLTLGCGGSSDTDIDDPDTSVEDAGDVDAGDEPDADAGDEPDADAGDEPDADVDPVEEIGTLILTLEGLPEDAEWPDIELVGDTTLSVPEGGQLDEVPAGEYELTADRVFRGLSTFDAPAQDIIIEADATLEVTLSYELIPAAWEVIIEGLPAGVDADVALEGPDLDEVLSASTTFDALTPGAYLLSPGEVTHEGAAYRAGIRTAALASGSNDATTITYTRSPGELLVQILGLPDGATADVIVTGPAGYENTLNDDATLSDLVPGDYTLSADEVTVGDQIFEAQPLTLNVASDASVDATLSFEPVPGELAIEVTGLPDGADFSATLVGPNPASDEQNITDPDAITELAAGTYTLNFPNVQAGGVTYEADPTSVSVDIASRQRAETAVTYTAAIGTVALSYELIGAGSITLRLGEGASAVTQTLSGQGTQQFLMPVGTYTLEVTANTLGTDSNANAYPLLGEDQEISVATGQTTAASISAIEPTRVISAGDSAFELGTLREVIARVNTGSTITFAPGITLLELTGFGLPINKELTIEGPGADLLTIRAPGSDRIFSIATNGDLHIEGMTLADSDILGRGGAVSALGGFSATDVDFINNIAGAEGGAIYLDTGATLGVLRRVRFVNNEADVEGGAIYSRVPLLIEDALFEGNYAYDGAAIYASNDGPAGNLVISRSLFDGNFATDNGGGVYNERPANVTNTTFFDNSATFYFGGAWYQYDGEATFAHTTFSANRSSRGYAIASFCDFTTSVYLKNSVVLGTEDNAFHCESSQQLITSEGNNYIQLGSDDFTTSTSDSVGVAGAILTATLSPLADNGGFTQTMAVSAGNDTTMRLPASACTDSTNIPVIEDQRGETRPNGGFCSIGAWENTGR